MHNVTKLPRRMTAWRFKHDELHPQLARYVWPDINVPSVKGYFLLNAGNPTVVQKLNPGDWIIETEFGCLYAVTHENFLKKYRMGHE